MPRREQKPVLGKRSRQWPRVRREHLKREPACAVCGSTTGLQVHHIRPFHLWPALELVQSNLITLCERPGHSCHHLAGHLLDWHAYNPDVRKDARIWAQKIKHRPMDRGAAA